MHDELRFLKQSHFLESTCTMLVHININQMQLADTCSKDQMQLQCKYLRLVTCSSHRLFCREHNYLVSLLQIGPQCEIGPISQNEPRSSPVYEWDRSLD